MSERPPAHVGALHTHGPPGKRRSCPVRGGVGCGETGVPRGGRDGVRQGPRAPTTEEQVLPAVTMERHSARAGEEVLSCHNVEGPGDIVTMKPAWYTRTDALWDPGGRPARV